MIIRRCGPSGIAEEIVKALTEKKSKKKRSKKGAKKKRESIDDEDGPKIGTMSTTINCPPQDQSKVVGPKTA